MEAHGEDLRALVGDNEVVEKIKTDYRTAALPVRTRAMLAYAEKLTRTPSEMTEGDIGSLRAHGFDDGDILDIVEITSFFNFINRIADALHVDVETDMRSYP